MQLAGDTSREEKIIFIDLGFICTVEVVFIRKKIKLIVFGLTDMFLNGLIDVRNGSKTSCICFGQLVGI